MFSRGLECTLGRIYIIIIIENIVHFGGPEWQACLVKIEPFESQWMPTEVNLSTVWKEEGSDFVFLLYRIPFLIEIILDLLVLFIKCDFPLAGG